MNNRQTALDLLLQEQHQINAAITALQWTTTGNTGGTTPTAQRQIGRPRKNLATIEAQADTNMPAPIAATGDASGPIAETAAPAAKPHKRTRRASGRKAARKIVTEKVMAAGG